jgi:hypothetical protein
MAITLGLGRTTVLEVLKVAGVEVRPHGRRYWATAVRTASRHTGIGADDHECMLRLSSPTRWPPNDVNAGIMSS